MNVEDGMPHWKRRELLKRSALLATAGAAPLSTRSDTIGLDYDVIIIGAGIAGLSAARLLSRAGPGLKVLVIEARDRIGGRIQTLQDISPHGVELGAQFIHGSGAQTWDLIREFGLETRSRPASEQEHLFSRSGGNAREALDEEALEQAYETLYRSWARRRRTNPETDPDYRTFQQSLGDGPDLQMAAAWDAQSWSADPDQVSTAAAIGDGILWEEMADEDFQVVGGYSQMIDQLATGFRGEIRKASVVTGLFWRQDLAGITYRGSSAERSLTASRIVMTVPVGVLQAGDIEIKPALPQWKKNALAATGMGQIVVAPMLFDTPFWHQEVSGPTGWSSRDGQVGFWAPHPGETPVINSWISGSAAGELSQLGPEAGMRQILRWLERATGHRELAGKLRWHHFRDWVSDPHARGSYSYTRPGGTEKRKALALPIDNTLFFAGEATAPAPHYQTVAGAYASGKRVAAEVAATLGLGDAEVPRQSGEEAPVIELL